MPIGASVETLIALAVAAGSGGFAVGRRVTDRALRRSESRPPARPGDASPGVAGPEGEDTTAEERILRHLRANGGQLRQQQLVEAHS